MPKEKKEKKINAPLVQDETVRKAPKVNIDSLEPAISEGRARFSVGDELILRRDHLNDKKLYVCSVTSLYENGDFQLRNLTLQQDCIFNVKNPPTLRILKRS